MLICRGSKDRNRNFSVNRFYLTQPTVKEQPTDWYFCFHICFNIFFYLFMFVLIKKGENVAKLLQLTLWF